MPEPAAPPISSNVHTTSAADGSTPSSELPPEVITCLQNARFVSFVASIEHV
jgi:hypothetical protein